MPLSSSRPSTVLANRVRSIFAARGLSLAGVARASRSLTSGNRLQHIPYNLYSLLRTRRFSPSLYQIETLSVLTGYRFADWLAVFGLAFEDVRRFQAALPAFRTVELDTQAGSSESLIPWFRENREPDFSAPVLPLGEWLRLGVPASCKTASPSPSAYRYAKIGSQDAYAFPGLLPGSIVRIRSNHSSKVSQPGKKLQRRYFLVEQNHGLVCAPLRRSSPGKFVLCSRQLPYAPVELEEGRDAIILGAADLEIRPLEGFQKPIVPENFGHFWTPVLLAPIPDPAHVGKRIRRARFRSGLSFRQASELTRIIAKALGDQRYYCAPGSLSDYEARKLPPRHIHKLISICSVYGARVSDLLDAAGVNLHRANTSTMPSRFRHIAADLANDHAPASTLFRELQRRFGEVPFFLRQSLGSVFGLRHISVRDIFWAGGVRGSIHPCLAKALFLILDRKRKSPRPQLSCPNWAQPVYVVHRRGGGYFSGFCTLEKDTLILRSCFEGTPEILRLRNRVDAEVVGKVVGIVRRLD
jgi:transcriptional regulator with XRE-family HTH domain